MAAVDPRPCKHFTRKGACDYGDACRFVHARPDVATTPSERATARKARRSDAHRKVHHFTEWLKTTFNLDGARVLDVAGGKGHLAFDVVNRTSAAEVCVVDPREMALDAMRRRFAERARRGGRWSSGDGDVREPTHVRVYWTRGMWERESDGWAERVRASYELARNSRWCVTGLVADAKTNATYEDRASSSSSRVKITSAGFIAPRDCDSVGVTGSVPDEDGERDSTLEETRGALEDVLRRCTHVIAMHPDQATDAAVDFALERGLPFAVVPCCVYSKEFTTRRLRSGQRVTTHEQLVQYLTEKSGLVDVHTAELPFSGKNIVVYSHGAARSTCDFVAEPR